MRRRLLNLLTALSLLLCVAVCGLWVRGYRHLDTFDLYVYAHATNPVDIYQFTLASGQGGLALGYDASRGRYSAGDLGPVLRRGWDVSHQRWDPEYAGSDDADAAKREWRAMGVRLYRYRSRRPDRDHSVWVTLPSWLVVTLTLTPPAAWAVRRRRAGARRATNQCGYCGYDLRATPDRWPECGRQAVAESC